MGINVLKYKNITISYSVQGEGFAVVLLHGFLENKSMWNSVTKNISTLNKVICIDLLGHGDTGSIDTIHTMEAQAQMLNFLLNHLKIDSFSLIGHSMGGYIGLAYAELFPDKITKLCLMNSTAAPDDDEKKKNRDRAIKIVKQNRVAFIKMAIPNLFAEENKSKFASEIEKITQDALKISEKGIIAAMEGMKIRKDRRYLLSNPNLSVLFIVGKRDPALNYTSLISQIKSNPVSYVELSDGHMSHIENKNELIQILADFIQI